MTSGEQTSLPLPAEVPPPPTNEAVTDSYPQGPVAQGVKDHTARASSELSNLAASRKTPTSTTATGQPLTHYHSFFHELLSWNNPREYI